MPLQNPVVAWTAANNVEVHLLAEMLENEGVACAAVDDVSQVGVWIGGLASPLHRPQLWVEKEDLERARVVLAAYEARQQERRREQEEAEPIAVVCEKCGHESSFPATQFGTVQNCPECYAYVDVGDDVDFDDWMLDPEAEAETEMESAGEEE